MAKLRLEVELDYDAELMHGADPEARTWFFDRVLRGRDLQLCDFGDLGDSVGAVRVIKIDDVLR